MTLGDRWNIGLASGDAETYDEGGTEQYGSMVAGDPRCGGERNKAKGDQQSTLDANSAGQAVGDHREDGEADHRYCRQQADRGERER